MNISKGVPGLSCSSPVRNLLLPRRLSTPSRVFLLQFCVEPEPGGLTEIFRTDYEHWAIYMEGGDVIHLGPPSKDC